MCACYASEGRHSDLGGSKKYDAHQLFLALGLEWSSLHFVRGVNLQLLTKQEQAGKHPRLEDRALAVLPGHDQPYFRRCPPTRSRTAQSIDKEVSLPR